MSQVHVVKSSVHRTRNGKNYYIHTVKKGQTAYSISRAYGIKPKQLLTENSSLSADFKLAVGDKLFIPMPQTVAVKTRTGKTVKKLLKNDLANYHYHTVKKGEWAYKIARDYNISYKVLKEENPDVDLSKLSEGSEVRIPKVSSSDRNVFVSDDGMIIRTVKPGDTYYSLAQEYNITEKQLRSYNSVQELIAGTVIRVPYGIQKEETPKEAVPDYKSYDLYEVKPKETLYRISKKVGVDLKLLMRINNISEDFVIKKGQKLKIPKAKFTEPATPAPVTEANQVATEEEQVVIVDPNLKKSEDPFGSEETLFVKHTVEKGQTAYAISKLHGIPVKILFEYNPEAEKVLSVGQTLKIPVQGDADFNEQLNKAVVAEKKEEQRQQDTLPKDKNIKRFALLLPLSLNDNQSKAKANFNKPIASQFFTKTIKFYKFYQGFEKAMQDLSREGKKVDLQVFDTENKASTVQRILNENDFRQFDMVVGPVYNSNLKLVADTVKKYQIPLISPLYTKPEETLQDYNKFFLVNTPMENQIKVIVSLIAKKSNTKIILVESNLKSEKKIAEQYEKHIMQYAGENLSYNKIQGTKELGRRIGQALSRNRHNVIIVASNNENTVTQSINDMVYYAKDYNMTLIGTQTWNRFNNNIELDHLFDLNLTMFTFNSMDFTNPRAKKFINEFTDKYGSKPNKYSFVAYDMGRFFFDNFASVSATNPQDQLGKMHASPASYGIQNNFHFVKPDSYTCLVNNSTRILRYDKSTYEIADVDELILTE